MNARIGVTVKLRKVTEVSETPRKSQDAGDGKWSLFSVNDPGRQLNDIVGTGEASRLAT